MSEAEKSIAVKRKVAVFQNISRTDSSNEAYLPKRKKSAPSPPPYIPSKKVSSPRKNEQDSKYQDGHRIELTSRSKRTESKQTVEPSQPVHSIEKRHDSKHDQLGREVKEDISHGIVKNFQIIAKVASPETIKSEKRISPDINVKRSVPVSSRLGKIVFERKVAREDIDHKLKPESTEASSGKVGARVLSRLGKAAVQKQCEEAVKSVKSSLSGDKAKVSVSPDSRIVCCDSIDEESDTKRHVQTSKDDGKSDLGENMSDDLSLMLEDETLDGQDEFTLDLDEEDVSNVVGEIDEEETDQNARASLKVDDPKSRTRFIVTLDGVDERQFVTSESHNDIRPVLPMPLQNSDFQKEKLHLDILSVQSRASSSLQQSSPLTQVSNQVLVNKLQPPKIQPFSINLKDSDDEHEEKDVKSNVIIKPSLDEEMEADDDDLEQSVLKKAKMSERCKFWPACAVGSACEYHHPTTYCKTFPSCKFGDKCLFIHPNCKFDSKCTRPDCPFTHTSRRTGLGAAAHVVAIPQPQVIFSAPPPLPRYNITSQVTCRFFPSCHNLNCPFLHPKPCRFGVSCTSATCTFYHPPLPGRNKLKWQAQDKSKLKLQAARQDDSTSHSTAVSSTSQ